MEMVVVLQRQLMTLSMEEEKQRLKRWAAMAQEWEDWVVRSAMDQPPSPKKRRTVATQVDPAMLAEGEGIGLESAEGGRAEGSGMELAPAHGVPCEELGEEVQSGVPGHPPVPDHPMAAVAALVPDEDEGNGSAHALPSDELPGMSAPHEVGLECNVAATVSDDTLGNE